MLLINKKIIMKRVLLLFCIVLSSCAAKLTKVNPERISRKNVNINEEHLSELGESVLLKESYERYKAVKILQEPGSIIKRFNYNVGDVLPLLAKTKYYYLFFRKEDVQEGVHVNRYGVYHTYTASGVAQDVKDSTYVEPFINSTDGALGGVMIKPSKNFRYEFTTYEEIKCDDCFKKEIVYNGRVGNNLKFIYREYISNLARPAFTQELQYDLSESNIIGFKGARIEIIEANNTNIKYKLLKDFDL